MFREKSEGECSGRSPCSPLSRAMQIVQGDARVPTQVLCTCRRS